MYYDYEEELEWAERQAEQSYYIEQQNQAYKAQIEEKCRGNEYREALEEYVHSSATILKLPEDVLVIPEGCFCNNTTIEEIILPDTIQCIGKNAFRNCTNLKAIYFPKNLSRICECAFYNCTQLSRIYIPERTKIDRFAFARCSNLEEIIFVDCEDMGQARRYENLYYQYKDNDYCDRENAYVLSEYAFAYCSKLRRMEGMHFRVIKECAFLLCKNLEEVVGSVLEEIKSFAFWGCDSLKCVVLNARNEDDDPYYRMCRRINDEYGTSEDMQYFPNIEIGKYAFPYNEYLEFEMKGACVKHFTDRDYEYYSCKALNQLASIEDDYDPWTDDSDRSYGYRDSWEKSYYDMDYDDMQNDPDYWEDLYDKAARQEDDSWRKAQSRNGKSGMQTLKHLEENPESLEEAVVPNGTKILKSSYKDYKKLRTVSLGKDIINIDSAFWGCKCLENVMFDERITLSKAEYSFKKCMNLKEITLPEKTWVIDKSMFENCINLREIIIPKNVRKIRKNAFKNCILLEKITIEGCPEIEDESWILGCYNLQTIKAPKNLKDLKAPGRKVISTKPYDHDKSYEDTFSAKKLETTAKKIYKYHYGSNEPAKEELEKVIQEINTKEKRYDQMRQIFIDDDVMSSNRKLITIIDYLCDNVGKNKQEENVLVLPSDIHELNAYRLENEMKVAKLLWSFGKKACLEREEQSVTIHQGKWKSTYLISHDIRDKRFIIREKGNSNTFDRRYIFDAVEMIFRTIDERMYN